MRAPFDGVDVVDEAADVLGEFAGILHGHLDADAFLFAGDVDHVGMGRLRRAVQVLDEGDDAALVLEHVAFLGPFIVERDLHAAIEKSQLLQPFVERVVVELGAGEDLRIRLEGGLGAALVGGADATDLGRRHAPFVFLLVHVPVAADFHPPADLHCVAERIGHEIVELLRRAIGKHHRGRQLLRLVVRLPRRRFGVEELALPVAHVNEAHACCHARACRGHVETPGSLLMPTASEGMAPGQLCFAADDRTRRH